MKIIYLIFFILILLSCNSSSQKQAVSETKAENNQKGSLSEKKDFDSSTWSISFSEFRNAILNKDREKVKSFIDFPIKNAGNEIWYLADTRLVMEMDTHKIVPFSESDFDKYYSSIFSIDFTKTIEKLNLEDLFTKDTASTPEIEVLKDAKSSLYAEHDKANHKLTLNLSSTIPAKDEETTEFSVIYEFDILKDQKIKFRQVRVAG